MCGFMLDNTSAFFSLVPLSVKIVPALHAYAYHFPGKSQSM